MLKQISHKAIPTNLHGPILIDENGLPRYWATVWQLFLCGDLAHSTQSKHLRHIEALYQFAAELDGTPALDDAISSLDMPGLSQILEGYFISIRNKNTAAGNAQDKWRNAYEFVRTVVFRHTRNDSSTATLQKLEAKLSRLDMLYQQLQISRRRTQETIRSLPASVVEALYEMLDPASSSNPFRNDVAKWRVFVLFVILLHQGLRRGEALNLPTDIVKSAFDSKAGSQRNWLAVATADTEAEDTRYNKPSIKNAQSIRQIPVSSLTANILQEYTQGYRGKPNHSFLLNSQQDKPLSPESVNKIFRKISRHLPLTALNDLKNRTGKTSITPHDLRHTCAVIRLNQLLGRGDSMDEALQKMRTFFGWSKSSDMPKKYARAVFEDRLAGVWNNVFDDRVAILRSIPKSQ